MNILLIGNGFDLAHDLPTKYENFLEFGEKVLSLSNVEYLLYRKSAIDRNLKAWNFNESVKRRLISMMEIVVDKRVERKILNELQNLLTDNIWFDYFKSVKNSMGNTWIDFESEISKVIHDLDEIRKIQNKFTENANELLSMEKVRLRGLLEMNKASSLQVFDMNGETEVLVTRLEKDLDRLIRALEIYLTEFVGQIDVVSRVKEIDELEIHKVLSFNYTNTYKRIYGKDKNIEYNYIHGIANYNNTIETNNMVLGIEEYLTDETKNTETLFMPFKKYFQRIYKGTDSNYFDWIEPTVKLPNKIYSNLYIFGHSLDVTDGDVLRMLILNKDIKTKIFYYKEYEDDKRTLNKLIKNLVKVIGQEELIKRTSGKNKIIEFIPQSVKNKELVSD